MATCNTDSLLATNPCLTTLDPFQIEVLKTQVMCALLNQLNGGPDVNCNIQTLLDDAKCFYATPPFILSVLQVQLLCNIAAAISGGGGSGGLQSGSGDPEGVADASNGQFYFNTDASPSGQSMWANLSTSGTTGWFLQYQF